MDMSELYDIINDIKSSSSDTISLKSIDDELNNIKFKMKCREETIENVKEWIMCNPCHTFPKKRHRWIKAFKSQRGLRKISVDCNVKELLILMKNKLPIPEHLSGLSVYIYDFLKYDDNTNELIGSYENVYVYITEYELYNNLVNVGFLFQRFYYTRVYINNAQLRYTCDTGALYEDVMNTTYKSVKRQREQEDEITRERDECSSLIETPHPSKKHNTNDYIFNEFKLSSVTFYF